MSPICPLSCGVVLRAAVLPSVVPPLVCGGLVGTALAAAANFHLSLREAGLGIAANWRVCAGPPCSGGSEMPQVVLLSRVPCDGTPCTEAQVVVRSWSLVLGKP